MNRDEIIEVFYLENVVSVSCYNSQLIRIDAVPYPDYVRLDSEPGKEMKVQFNSQIRMKKSKCMKLETTRIITKHTYMFFTP